MKYLLKNSALLSAANLTAAAAQFALVPIYIQAVGHVEYGKLALIQVGIFICVALFNFEVWIPLTKKITESVGSAMKMHVKTGIFVEIVSTVLSSIFFLAVLAFLYYYPKNPLHIEVVWGLLGFFSILFSQSGTLLSYLRANGRWLTVASYLLIPSLVKLLLSLAIKVEGVSDILAIQVLGDAVRVPYLVVLAWGVKGVSPGPVVSLIKDSLYGWLGKLSDLPITQLDKYMVGILLGLESVAIYHIVKGVAAAFGQVAGPLYQVAYPSLIKEVADTHTGVLLNRYLKLSIAIILLGICGLGVLSATSGFWLEFFFTEKMIKNNVSVLVYMQILIQIVAIAFFYIHPMMLAKDGYKEHLVVTVSANILFAGLVILLSGYGVFGVQSAAAIQVVMTIALKFWLVKRSEA